MISSIEISSNPRAFIPTNKPNNIEAPSFYLPKTKSTYNGPVISSPEELTISKVFKRTKAFSFSRLKPEPYVE
jgi:hypothetical protein